MMIKMVIYGRWYGGYLFLLVSEKIGIKLEVLGRGWIPSGATKAYIDDMIDRWCEGVLKGRVVDGLRLLGRWVEGR